MGLVMQQKMELVLFLLATNLKSHQIGKILLFQLSYGYQINKNLNKTYQKWLICIKTSLKLKTLIN